MLYNTLLLVKDGVPLQPDDNSHHIDEAVWQAWLKKNKAQDALRYRRRLRAMVLLAAFLALSVLLWKFSG